MHFFVLDNQMSRLARAHLDLFWGPEVKPTSSGPKVWKVCDSHTLPHPTHPKEKKNPLLS